MLKTLLQSRLVRALASARLGIVLGLLASALLGLSSVLMPSPRSDDALPFSESMVAFFDPVSARFWWFYLLLAIFAAFSLSLVFSVLRTSLLRRRDAWNPHAVAVVLMHVGVLGALTSHLLAGFTADIEEGAVITKAPVRVAGHRIELVTLERSAHPDGSLRGARATVRIDGERLAVLGYNEPLFFDGLTRWVLLERLVDAAGAARFEVGAGTIVVGPGETFEHDRRRFRVEAIHTNRSLRTPMAQVRELSGEANEPTLLAPGWLLTPTIRLVALEPSSAPAVIVRRNDGLPVLLGASIVFCAGLVLFWWSRTRRRMGAS